MQNVQYGFAEGAEPLSPWYALWANLRRPHMNPDLQAPEGVEITPEVVASATDFLWESGIVSYGVKESISPVAVKELASLIVQGALLHYRPAR